MGKFYGMKIIRGDINSKTGEPWTIDDVPRLYRAKVEEFIANYFN